LNGGIELSDHLEREIEAVLAARTGRECVFVPSGRFGIYLSFRLLLSPGQRILMSPLEDDAVFFGALAAGLRPVMTTVSTVDGNVDFSEVAEKTWSGIGAVLTGNTYGFPDRVLEARAKCAELGIPLIEDAAHALETELDGRAIGSFGTASLFSLSKHLPGRGGVLSLGEGVDRTEVIRMRDRLMKPTPTTRRVTGLLRTVARPSVQALHLRHLAEGVQRGLHPVRLNPWRIALRAPELRDVLSSSTDLDSFEPWMNAGYPDFRMRQRSSVLKRTLGYLREVERDRERRVAGVLRLRELDAVAPAARNATPLPLLRVPLLVEDRDLVALELRRRRIKVYFLYAPPLDDYAGAEFLEPSPAPEAARWWAEHVLPIDPRDAERVLDLAARHEIRLRPAFPPSDRGAELQAGQSGYA
jgi:DegT/DnrJ/EryC1/StrS aminotransferase family